MKIHDLCILVQVWPGDLYWQNDKLVTWNACWEEKWSRFSEVDLAHINVTSSAFATVWRAATIID